VKFKVRLRCVRACDGVLDVSDSILSESEEVKGVKLAIEGLELLAEDDVRGSDEWDDGDGTESMKSRGCCALSVIRPNFPLNIPFLRTLLFERL